MRRIDRRIEVKVSGAYLDKDNRNAGVQYESNVTELRIEFDEGWDNYAKTVTFWNALMANPVKRTLTTDLLEDGSTRVYIVPIPGEALTEAGDMTFVIDGYVDGKRKRSVSAELWVSEAPYAEDAAEPSDPTPSQAEQLQEQVDDIIATIAEANIARNEAKAAAQQASTDAGIAAGALAEIQGYDSDAKEQAQAAADAAAEAEEWAQSASDDAATAKKWRDEAEAKATAAANSAKNANESAEDARADAEAANDSAAEAAGSAKAAANSATAAASSATTANSAKSAAETAKAAAESARSAAAGSASNAATFATRAETAETNAETARKKAEAAQTAAEAAADRAEEIAIGGLATEAYVNEKAAERVAKTGDSMSGILTFETPGLFSAFAKRRTINGTDYLMRVGIGNDGEDSGGTFSLRLFTLANGIETRVAQLDMDKAGLTYTTPGGVRKTIAHSGNIGVLTASLEG